MQRKLIWELSRNEGLTNEQIAEQLIISKNTVKNPMGLTLKHVRGYLEKRAMHSIAAYLILVSK